MDYHWTISMEGDNEEPLVRIFPDIDDKYKTWNLLRIESDITEVDSAFEEVHIKISASPETVPVFIPWVRVITHSISDELSLLTVDITLQGYFYLAFRILLWAFYEHKASKNVGIKIDGLLPGTFIVRARADVPSSHGRQSSVWARPRPPIPASPPQDDSARLQATRPKCLREHPGSFGPRRGTDY